MRAIVKGRRIEVLRPDVLIELSSVEAAPAWATVEEIEAQGQTAMVVTADSVVVGVLAITDQLRPGAADAVGRLTALTAAPPVLLTGDNYRAADALAAEVGIHDVRARLLPEEKVNTVRALEAAGQRVAVAGPISRSTPRTWSSHATSSPRCPRR